MSLQDLNKVAVQSTGQTVKDLLELNALWSILQVDDNPYISESWLPPAILNPEYIPERQQGLKIGLTVVFLFGLLTTGSLVGFKVITTQKHRAAKTLFLEDWLLVLALFSGYAVLIVSFVSVYKYQAGWHIWDVHIESAEETFKLIMVVNLLSIWTYTVTRISLLLSIRRLYSGFKTRMQLVCDILIICKFLYCGGSFMTLVFQVPNHPGVLFDIWKSTTYRARPLNLTAGICAAGLFLDCLILLTPLPLVPMLKRLTFRRKAQISLVFLCGFLTITASAVRLWQMIILRDIIVSDQTYYVPILELVNYFEIILAITTSCLPSAKFFFRWAYNRKSFPMNCRGERPAETSRQGFFSEAPTHAQLPEVWNSRFYSPSVYASKADVEAIITPIRHNPQAPGIRPMSTHSNSLALLDECEDDDDNFYDHLQPSEAFFPSAIGLTPRPIRG